MATLNNQMVEVKNEHKYDRDLCKPHEVNHSSLTKWWEAEKARHLIPIWPWLDTGHFLSKHFIFIPTTENTQKKNMTVSDSGLLWSLVVLFHLFPHFPSPLAKILQRQFSPGRPDDGDQEYGRPEHMCPIERPRNLLPRRYLALRITIKIHMLVI